MGGNNYTGVPQIPVTAHVLQTADNIILKTVFIVILQPYCCICIFSVHLHFAVCLICAYAYCIWACFFIACQADEFMCRDGLCVDMLFRCNGQVECEDGSDEDDCSTLIGIVKCSCGMFQVGLRRNKIHELFRCNG